MDKLINNIIYKSKHHFITKDSALGLFAMVILSKELLKTNHLVAEFINQSLEMTVPNYAKKSRTLMCAKCLRALNDFSEEKLYSSVNKASVFIKDLTVLTEENNHEGDIFIEKNSITKPKSKKSLNNMKKWITAINDKVKK